jgi:hypothetical protein
MLVGENSIPFIAPAFKSKSTKASNSSHSFGREIGEKTTLMTHIYSCPKKMAGNINL